MTNINYLNGDATFPDGSGRRILCHNCNNEGVWGVGFGAAVSRRWRSPQRQYRKWHAESDQNDFALGAVLFVQVEPELWVANMVGQHGLSPSRGVQPLRYVAVVKCLKKVAAKALELQATVHMPRIGCGLAGGDWSRIEPLVDEHLCRRKVQVTVYDFAD